MTVDINKLLSAVPGNPTVVQTGILPSITGDGVTPASTGTTGGTVVLAKRKYMVQLEGEPAEEIEADDRLQAQELYNQKLGIISSTRKYSYVELR